MRLFPLCLFALALTLTGCGQKQGNISGVVRYQGKPLPSGRIVFICEGGEKPVLTADIREGAYAIPAAPFGPVKVTVATFETRYTPVPGQPSNIAPPGGGKTGSAGKYVAIPARYAKPETSGLGFTVSQTEQVESFDLEP